MRLLFVFIIAALSLSACNTFQGMGRDLSALGNAMSGN